MINKVADDNDVAELSALLQCVPTETIDFAFAYGSGAVAQRTNRADNMVDFIIATNSAENFHRSNLRTNAAHYSIVRHFGVAAIARIQCNYAARIYYNTRVRTGNRMIKYGVIETGHLIGDLLDWQSIYAAGRLHKPTVIVHPTNDRQLQAALRVNLQNAMRVALLLLPESFDVDQVLYS
jgi:translocator assembly and maintenance protein 41